ncbi:MAG: cupin domain-containing protein [Coriobacteriia bacterium]|nr:cupin domain-containing protein [Coriobacteriia bacterium]
MNNDSKNEAGTSPEAPLGLSPFAFARVSPEASLGTSSALTASTKASPLDLTTELRDLGQRIAGLRDALGYSADEFADLLGEDREVYSTYEKTGFNIPASLLMHIANVANVDMGVLLTGKSAHLDTFQVVRAGEGRKVDRFPGYHFQDLAYAYSGKTMQPLLVTLQASDEPAALVTHSGQEFNYVTKGTVILVFADREIELHVGDSVYFNPMLPHGQRCGSDEPATFVTMIME